MRSRVQVEASPAPVFRFAEKASVSCITDPFAFACAFGFGGAFTLTALTTGGV